MRAPLGIIGVATAIGIIAGPATSSASVEDVALFRSACMETFPDVGRAQEVLESAGYSSYENGRADQTHLIERETDARAGLWERPRNSSDGTLAVTCALKFWRQDPVALSEYLVASVHEVWPAATVTTEGLAEVLDEVDSQKIIIRQNDAVFEIFLVIHRPATSSGSASFSLRSITPLPVAAQ